MKFTRMTENGEHWYITQSGQLYHERAGEKIYKATFKKLKDARKHVKNNSYMFVAR